ncbi:MAG: hypothetical protein A2W90_18895 [Bacteroidetes bacterium GWF2_42_66]|nr:MAG: hypothetical protein A2W92_05700 [Bacteroidetes bacterium GWA2_42_15]OFX98761.1 MAG: hypothetical protein A2W89_10800 [Bacteroidetes bacterium GWE2_42_39]OFY43042.1 MAG: hypothetical protein A2W90_18895 [Bacteroidetes bacterium GWF2_42_66]HAZ02816.1 hypothetical protein [Marinilabiliales bacterium]HBL77118.1 hypothetical protein [Prolixibacteraceae bacterium]
MKLLILFTGLFSLLFFSRKEFEPELNSNNPSVIADWTYFEAGRPNAIGGIENTESNFFASSDRKTSYPKKRTFWNKNKSSDTANQYYSAFSHLKLTSVSKINLFLVFHFSLSLWQVFLQ